MSNGRINQALGSGPYATFYWPPQDSNGMPLSQITIHTWQCSQCRHVVGIGASSQAEGILALQSHRCPPAYHQPDQLAAD